jgi:hypothetical protein
MYRLITTASIATNAGPGGVTVRRIDASLRVGIGARDDTRVVVFA